MNAPPFIELPIAAADVVIGDIFVQSLTLVNNGAAAVTVTIKDKQTSPITVVNALSLAVNSAPVVLNFGGQLFKGGINAVASVASSAALGIVPSK